MKRRSPTAIFIRGFIKSFLLIALLFIVGFGSYKVTMFYYKVTDTSVGTKIDELIKDVVSDVQIDDISKNLIYSYNKNDRIIENIVLEIFNTYTKNMDYITIPVETQFTVSDKMYQRLCVANPEVPQIITLSEISRYFSEDTMYEYGLILLEELLNIDLSFYTAVQSEDFNFVFVKEDNELVLLDSYLEELKQLDTKDKLKEYIKDWYEKIKSNFTYENKLKYIDSFMEINVENIYCHILAGHVDGKVFNVDIEENNTLFDKIINNNSYTISQADYEANNKGEIISSKELNIQIDNGSKVSGLASTYRDKLTKAGYKVLGIGNYKENNIENSRIIVKEQGYGKDLLTYFNSAVIETGKTPENIDIWIIIGKEDSTDN